MNIETRIINLTQRMLKIRQESILDKFENILEKEEIVAHTIDGKPLTRKEYKAKINLAKKEVEKGNYITQENLIQEAKQW